MDGEDRAEVFLSVASDARRGSRRNSLGSVGRICRILCRCYDMEIRCGKVRLIVRIDFVGMESARYVIVYHVYMISTSGR